MKDKIFLKKKSFEGKDFYYIDFGSAKHWQPSFRLWVNKSLISIEKNENGEDVYFIELPIRGAKVEKTEKETLVLRKDEEYNTFYLPTQSCGYRGESWFSIVNDPERDVYVFENYESPRGNLGIKRGGLIVSKKDEIMVMVESNGREGYSNHHMKINLNGDAEGIELNKDEMELLL